MNRFVSVNASWCPSDQRKIIRRRVGQGVTVSVIACMLTMPALAQTTAAEADVIQIPAPNGDAAASPPGAPLSDKSTEIVVTGSRIRNGKGGPNPVTTVTDKQLSILSPES